MKITEEKLKTALAKSYGNISETAKAIGCGRKAVYSAIERYGMQEELLHARDQLDDDIENVFYNKVLAGNTPELIFYMKTRMRHRGYVEKFTVEKSVDGLLDAFNGLSEEEQTALVSRLAEEEDRRRVTN